MKIKCNLFIYLFISFAAYIQFNMHNMLQKKNITKYADGPLAYSASGQK